MSRWKGILIALLIVTLSIVPLIIVFGPDRLFRSRDLEDLLRGLKGGRTNGLLLAYTGSLMIVAAQFYTIVKRAGIASFINKLKGSQLWLKIHIALAAGGLAAVLLHAGFPYRFNYDELFTKGFSVLATWLIIASAISGSMGYFLFQARTTHMKRMYAAWKPIHSIIAILTLFFSVAHMAAQLS